MHMHIKNFKIINFLLILKYANTTQEGDSCQITSTGKLGTCRILRECKLDLDEIGSRGFIPQFCGKYRRKDPIICCEGGETLPTSTISTTTSTTTTTSPVTISSEIDLRRDGSYYEGSSCTLKRTGQIGECKPFTSCSVQFADFMQRKIAPEFCTFGNNNSDPIICCTKEEDPRCQIPNHPPNGVYVIEGSNEAQFTAGDYVAPLKILSVNCDTNYKINPPGPGYSLCVKGKWIRTPATCSRSCPPINSTETTQIKCKFQNIPLENCANPIEGTIAEISCGPLYEEPSILYNPTRVCRDGTWDSPIPRCFPICGQKRPKGRTNIINGTKVVLGDFPWQIGVYTTNHQFICGGAILNRKVLLSAAHCFANREGELLPKENYLISAGKYYRPYNDARDGEAQYATIQAIHIPERYRGGITHFEADVAVIVLTKALDLTESVQPVCIDLSNTFEYQQLTPDSYGVVTGWGFTEEGENLAEELKEISVPFIPYDRCFDAVPRAFRKYVTYDKICAGYLENGSAVCGGDSGGALVFPRHTNDRYYVRGIVSTSPATDVGVCDSNQYSTYTLVSKHLDFIKDLLTLNRI